VAVLAWGYSCSEHLSSFCPVSVVNLGARIGWRGSSAPGVGRDLAISWVYIQRWAGRLNEDQIAILTDIVPPLNDFYFAALTRPGNLVGALSASLTCAIQKRHGRGRRNAHGLRVSRPHHFLAVRNIDIEPRKRQESWIVFAKPHCYHAGIQTIESQTDSGTSSGRMRRIRDMLAQPTGPPYSASSLFSRSGCTYHKFWPAVSRIDKSMATEPGLLLRGNVGLSVMKIRCFVLRTCCFS